MDDQESVFVRYPNAEARHEPSIFEHGTTEPIQVEHWAIFPGPDLDGAELGRGRSEAKKLSENTSNAHVRL